MPRIGFDGRALASPAAGVRRYTRELFGALAALERDLTVIAVGAPPTVDVPEGVERSASVAALPTNAGWMVTGLPRAAHRARVDLFHAPSYTTPLGGPRPLVVTIHDVSYERHPEWYPYRRDWFRRLFYRRCAQAADRVITDSRFSKQEIVAAYGLRPETIHVVPLAAAPAFKPGPPLPLPPGCSSPFVLHVGDVHTRRNLPMAASAVAAVRARSGIRNMSLVLAGVDRGGMQAVRDVGCRAAGETPVVTLLGPAAEDTLLALYRSAAALVYPSRYEGFGLPLLEAMACGTPVIAADTSSIPEVVGEAAVLLDPDDQARWADAIERVLNDRPYATALQAAGLRQAARFSWSRTAAETARVYRALLNGAHGQRRSSSPSLSL